MRIDDISSRIRLRLKWTFNCHPSHSGRACRAHKLFIWCLKKIPNKQPLPFYTDKINQSIQTHPLHVLDELGEIGFGSRAREFDHLSIFDDFDCWEAFYAKLLHLGGSIGVLSGLAAVDFDKVKSISVDLLAVVFGFD